MCWKGRMRLFSSSVLSIFYHTSHDKTYYLIHSPNGHREELVVLCNSPEISQTDEADRFEILERGKRPGYPNRTHSTFVKVGLLVRERFTQKCFA